MSYPESPPPPEHVMPLQYSNPLASRGRPGLVTAIAVLSIVVACLNGLGNLSGALQAGMLLFTSRMNFPVPTAAPAPAPAGTRPTMAPASTAPTVANTTTVAVGTSTVTVAAGPTAPMANPFANINTGAAAASLVTSVAGIGLAALLLVAGILMLRDSRHAVRLHWWYAALKIPLVVIATAVTVWMWSGFIRSLLTSTPGMPPMSPAQSWMMHISTLIGALMALAYPVALIFLLRSRTLRDYFNEVHASAATPLHRDA